MSTLTAGAGPAEEEPAEEPGDGAEDEPGAALAAAGDAEADGAAAPAADADADPAAPAAPFADGLVCASAATEYAAKGSARQTKLRTKVTRRRIAISLLFELLYERGPIAAGIETRGLRRHTS
jgi:hypothetical protein